MPRAVKEKQTICAILLEIMPLKTPSSSSKSGGKPKGKVLSPSHGKGNAAHKAPPAKGKAVQPSQPVAVSASWWESLSGERKLDVVGAIMSVVGLLVMLVLFSPQRSTWLEYVIVKLSQMFGWGIYILPVGLILMGFWLIFRRIEKLPPLSIERATGILLFFFWLLAIIHSITLMFIPVTEPEQVVLAGQGGGKFGDIFARILFNGFGVGGAMVALLAWLLITLIMIFDIS